MSGGVCGMRWDSFLHGAGIRLWARRAVAMFWWGRPAFLRRMIWKNWWERYSVAMPWMGRPPFLPLPLGTCINKGFADPFLQVFSRIFWKRLFWRWFLACSQFVHICRRSKGNFSLSAALIITDFFRFHKKIITWAFYTIPYSFL